MELHASPIDAAWFTPGSCRGKVPHTSKSHARGVLRVLLKSGTLRPGHTLQVYRCTHCKKWHLGNRYQNGPHDGQ